ncbi:unnamed protein product [Rhizoctonia solani]|uniref:Uncharacterized protein n=1 Tax=Rhizoctonia solani TaxID=456999 RepID=A0A8H3CMP8_9AGAM|nr:unnamed protein product [Rhizoctonia solani]
MTHAFDIPEILSLICEQAQLERHDLVRLLTTTRLFFHFAVPRVWGSLPDSAPKILIKLLPNSDNYLKRTFDDALIKRLQPLDAGSLARFDIYAPHVKQVERHRLNQSSDIMWDRLLKLVDRRPILPNLEILNISLATFGADTVHDPNTYLSAHLTPKLIEFNEFEIVPRGVNSFMGPHCFHDVVSAVAQQCPHIKLLKLSSNVTFSVGINPTLEAELANSLDRLRHLHTLKLGKTTLGPEILAAMGRLPDLKILDLGDVASSLGITSLPHSSFPALQHLGMELSFINDSISTNSVWSITATARRIKSISVCTKDCNYFNIDNLARNICQYSPFVTSLCLAYDHSYNYDSVFSPELINILAQLPLQRLCILGNNSRYKERWDSGRFAIAFQNLECLTIIGYEFTFMDFKNIAKHMPRLRQLSASVEVIRWPSKHIIASLALTASPSQLCLYFGVAGFLLRAPDELRREEILDQKLEAIAAGLHAFWPKGLICEAYEVPDSLNEEPSYTDKINATLEQLRGDDGHGNETQVTLQDHARRCNPSWFKIFDAE